MKETTFHAGADVRYSGVYLCTSCGKKKTLMKGKRLTPCSCGSTRWELTAHGGKTRTRDKNFLERLLG